MRTFYMNPILNEAFKMAQPLPRFAGRATMNGECGDRTGSGAFSYAAPISVALTEPMQPMLSIVPSRDNCQAMESFA